VILDLTRLLLTIAAAVIPQLLAVHAIAQEPSMERKYEYGPDSIRHENVPRGEVTTQVWKDSQVVPGTIRRYYVYVPQQYDAAKPAALMVFQDGHTYIKEDGDFRVPVVFDNLIHKGEMPVTIAIGIAAGETASAAAPQSPRFNRSLEFDSLNDQLARFALEEVFPAVERHKRPRDCRSGYPRIQTIGLWGVSARAASGHSRWHGCARCLPESLHGKRYVRRHAQWG
jgi:enterochelin esterase-like enzyme